MPTHVRIGLIGGGRTGSPLLEVLVKKPYVEVKGVVDKNSESQGVKVAKANGIFTSDDAMDLAKMGDQIDILIEVSGDPKVKKEIKEYYNETGNRTTIILHDIVARLLASIATGADELMPSYHPDDVGVG